MVRNVLLLLAAVALVALLALLGLVLEDRTYPAYRYAGPAEDPHRQAILLTWDAPSDALWEPYRAELHPLLQRHHEEGHISLVLPLEHPPLTHPEFGGRWSQAVLVMAARGPSVAALGRELLNDIQASALSPWLVAVDVMRLQPGLDLFYPARDGVMREPRLTNTIEYVFSNPEARDAYYADQYTLSGPAMADLHSRDKAGRFIGFEVEQRLFGASSMPTWDVLHVVGFTPWQNLKAVPFFLSTWARHARRVHGDGETMFSRLAAWEKIRVNVKSDAVQQLDLSLAPLAQP
ncbi:MAG: hypothetical protein AAGA48_34290 [Myxococcota bacterium]